MVNEDILSSLRNALDRGEDVDTAIRSMITAGYDRFEVNEAAKTVIKEIAELQIPEGQRLQEQPAKTSVASQTLLPSQSQQVQTKAPKPKVKKGILITAIIFLLIIVASLLYLLITKFI